MTQYADDSRSTFAPPALAVTPLHTTYADDSRSSFTLWYASTLWTTPFTLHCQGRDPSRVDIARIATLTGAALTGLIAHVLHVSILRPCNVHSMNKARGGLTDHFLIVILFVKRCLCDTTQQIALSSLYAFSVRYVLVGAYFQPCKAIDFSGYPQPLPIRHGVG